MCYPNAWSKKKINGVGNISTWLYSTITNPSELFILSSGTRVEKEECQLILYFSSTNVLVVNKITWSDTFILKRISNGWCCCCCCCFLSLYTTQTALVCIYTNTLHVYKKHDDKIVFDSKTVFVYDKPVNMKIIV